MLFRRDFKAKNNGLNLSRQITQIGSEIIGIENNFCEKEVINLIIEALRILKIKKILYKLYYAYSYRVTI